MTADSKNKIVMLTGTEFEYHWFVTDIFTGSIVVYFTHIFIQINIHAYALNYASPHYY